MSTTEANRPRHHEDRSHFDRVPLDAVITTDELIRRPSRPPDFEAENRALGELMHELARAEGNVLQALAETALRLCRAHSAGLSILEEGDDGERRFRWRAAAGQWSGYLGGTMPRAISPCGTVLDRDTALLMSLPERHYPFPPEVTLPIHELLLVPFHVDGQARGTIWIMSHDPNRRFEREDLRLTTSLGRFAATAYQVAAAHQLKASLTARQAIAAQQARELAAMQQLQEISTRLVQMDNGETLYDEILAAAIAMMDAEKATLQRFAAEDRSLRLIAFKGFDPADTVNWTTIDEHSGTISAAALRVGRRVLVPNAAHAELPADVFDPESMLGCGLRAGQTTPLVSRSGRLLGMLTTYWRRPHEPAERELRLLDVLARQAADFIERTGAEERLRFSEQRLSELLDSLPAAIYTTDAQGVVTFYNQATIEFAGRTPALGRDQWCVSWRLYHPDGAPMSHDQSPMAAALRADRPIRGMEAVLERPDGTRVPFIPFPTPLHDASGKVVGAVNMLVDITERKRTETMLSGQKQVLEMLATGAPLDDVLSALLHLIESQSDGLLGGMFVVARESNRFALGVAPSLAPEYAELLLRAPVGPPYPTPCSYAASTAEPVAVADIASERRWSDEWRESALRAGLQSCRVSPILGSDGKPVGAFTLYDRRRRPIPSDLRLLQTATYLAGIAIERRQAEEALRESDQRKNEFLAMLAHELRNPLAPIRNGLGIVGRDHNAPAAVQTAVTMMRRQIDQMVRLVDDLLDVSRISRGKIALRKERFDLQSALSQAVEAALPLCERKSQQLSVTLPPRPVVLDADPARFVQVVGNLLNNASKFTPAGGQIQLSGELSGGSDGDRGDQVVIRVRDTGIGMAAEQLPRIFEMFMQGDSTLERTDGGLGIGLTLVKHLVELHGGTVNAYSDGPGCGSEFCVRLPLPAPPAAQAPPNAAAAPAGAAARRILVVDDYRDTAETMAILLRLSGHETHVAHDGPSAIAAAERFRPEFVLLDIGLPGLNGYEVARRIRGEPWSAGMVLIALTGWGQDEDRQKSKDAGFDAHLIKPVDHDALLQLMSDFTAGGGKDRRADDPKARWSA